MSTTVAIPTLGEAQRMVVTLAPNIDAGFRFVVSNALADPDAPGDHLFTLGDALLEIAHCSAMMSRARIPPEVVLALGVQATELHALAHRLSMEGARRMLAPPRCAS